MGTRALGRAPGVYRVRGGGVSYNVHEGQGTRGTILSDWEVWCIYSPLEDVCMGQTYTPLLR